MKNVLKTLNTIIKTNKSIIKKQNDIECHLNRSVSMEEPNGLDATSESLILSGFSDIILFIKN